MLKKIKQMPPQAAIAIMIACILVGLLLGNGRALRNAVATTEKELAEVHALSGERLAKSKNLLTIALRAMPDNPATASLREAISNVESATALRELGPLNSHLSEAVKLASTELSAFSQEKGNLQAAMDNFTSADKQMQRVIVSYNAYVQDVNEIYQGLPTRWLLGGILPEVYP